MVDAIADRYELFLDGQWAVGEESFEVTDPATNDTLASVSSGNEADVDMAVHTADDALEDWTKINPAERGHLLRDISNAIRDEADKLARIETAESGRPLSESQMLISGTVGLFEFFAGMTDKIQGETIPVQEGRLNYTVREPLGVTAHIIPWNSAAIIGARSIAPALASGNTVVAKPAREAPLSTLEIARIANDAGLPDGVVNVVPGKGSTVGAALTSHEGVHGIVFTGSLGVGKTVMKAAADNVVPVELELGGKSPSIVFDDADLDNALENVLRVYDNTGQICFSTNRLFVHDAIYDEFVSRLADEVRELKYGPGIEDRDLGPVISPEAREDIHSYVEGAKSEGAEILAGGEIPTGPGNFYPATLVADVDDDQAIACDEVFGPVMTAHRFSDESEVIKRANDTNYGLFAAVYTTDLGRAHRVASEIEAGNVVVNEYPATAPQVPFGGYKESGIGREKGMQAIDHYTQLKNVAVDVGTVDD